MGTPGIEGVALCDLGLEPGTSEYRLQHSWSLARQVALTRDGFQCACCSASDVDVPLVVHHVHPVTGGYGPSCEHHVDGLVSLCRSCHLDIHRVLRLPEGTQLVLAVTV